MPGHWKLVDLIEHTGMVHRWQTEAARESRGSFPDEAIWRHGPADGQSWAEWFQAGVDDALAVEPGFAIDGINEMFDMFLPASGPEEIGGNGETVHLHATDAEGEWLVTVHPQTITVEPGHAKGDAAVRGTASDLLLFVWGRSFGQPERIGDEAAIDKLYASFKI